MSITQLPSGKWRAQVWDANKNKKVSVSLILALPSATFATRADAEYALALATDMLRLKPKAKHRKVEPERITWHLKTKGETACRVCEAPATHLHHIVPKAKAPDGYRDIEGNSMALCSSCHRRWHARVIDINGDLLDNVEFRTACKLAGYDWMDRHYPGSIPAIERDRSFRLPSKRPCPLRSVA